MELAYEVPGKIYHTRIARSAMEALAIEAWLLILKLLERAMRLG